MTFLNPAILLGLMAAAIPIVIHLLNLRRRKRMEFSSLMLLQEIEKSSLRRFKVRQWLLLALRSLTIFCLVASFSKPIFSGYLAGSEFSSRTKTSAVLLIDASPSMGYSDSERDGGEVWRQTKAAALRVLENLSSQDEIFLSFIGASGGAGDGGDLTEPLPISAAKEKLAQAEPLSQTVSTEEKLAAALARLQTSKHFNRELYLISDFQATGFTAKDTAIFSSLNQSALGDVKLYAINTAPDAKRNVGIIAAEVLTKILEPEKPVRIRTTLLYRTDDSAAQSAPARPTYVKLFFGDKLATETAIDLLPNQPAELILTATPTAQGHVAARVQCDGDNLDADNLFHFSFFIPEQLRVLVAANSEQGTRFLRIALESFRNKNFFDLTLTPDAGLEAKDLSRFDAVLLAGVSQFSPTTIQKLRQYASQGGGVIYFAASKNDYTTDNTLLSALGAGSFTPAPLGSEKSPLSVELTDTKNLIFDGVFERRTRRSASGASGTDGITDGDGIQLFGTPRYQKSPRETAVMTAFGGQAVMTTLTNSNTKLVCFAMMPSPQASTFALHPMFAPLMFRSVFFVSAKAATLSTSFIAGERAEAKLPALTDAGKTAGKFTVKSPDGTTFIAPTKSQSGETKLVLEPSLFKSSGMYEVFGGEETSMKSATEKIAVNIKSSESEVRTLGKAGIKTALEKAGLVEKNVFYTDAATSSESVSQMISGSRFGFGVWKYLVALAAVCLIAESVIARRTTA